MFKFKSDCWVNESDIWLIYYEDKKTKTTGILGHIYDIKQAQKVCNYLNKQEMDFFLIK